MPLNEEWLHKSWKQCFESALGLPWQEGFWQEDQMENKIMFYSGEMANWAGTTVLLGESLTYDDTTQMLTYQAHDPEDPRQNITVSTKIWGGESRANAIGRLLVAGRIAFNFLCMHEDIYMIPAHRAERGNNDE